MNNILSIQEVKQLGETLRQEGQKIVLVGGCFDLLHLGHIRLLREAKKQGNVLIVLLESDARIQQLKGSNRPLHTQQERAEILSSIRAVDYIILLPTRMHNADYEKVTKWLQPAIIATTQGSNSLQYIEKQAKEVGAHIYLVPKIENLSTSRIIDVITKEL